MNKAIKADSLKNNQATKPTNDTTSQNIYEKIKCKAASQPTNQPKIWINPST